MEQQKTPAFFYNHQQQTRKYNVVMVAIITVSAILWWGVNIQLGMLAAMLLYFVLKNMTRTHYRDFLSYLQYYLGPEHHLEYDYILARLIVVTYRRHICNYSLSPEASQWLKEKQDPIFAPLEQEITTTFDLLNRQYRTGRIAPLVLLLVYVLLLLLFVFLI